MDNPWTWITQGPIAGWLAYVHFSRPSRKECEGKHKTVEVMFASISAKIDNVQRIQEGTHALLLKHIMKNDG